MVSLLGLEFAGKTQISKLIKDRYGFNLIFINELIENKLKDFSNMQENGIEVDGDTAKLAEACYKG